MKNELIKQFSFFLVASTFFFSSFCFVTKKTNIETIQTLWAYMYRERENKERKTAATRRMKKSGNAGKQPPFFVSDY
jgi:hypothetical protein